MAKVKEPKRQLEARIKALYLMAIATAQRDPALSAEFARKAEELEKKHGLPGSAGRCG